MKNRRHAPRNAARLAALALSAFLLSGAARAEDWIPSSRIESPDITITVDGSIILADKSTDGNGGALHANPGSVTLSAGEIIARGNSAYQGGAIWANSDVTVSADEVSFTRNSATLRGGAIFAGGGVDISGGTVWFDQNTASGSEYAHGGAIFALGYVKLTGGTVSFTSNTTTGYNYGYGGAIYAGGDVTLTGDSIAVIGNRANSPNYKATGGAIYSSLGNVTLTGDSIAVTGNSATTNGSEGHGGAIEAKDDVTLTGGAISLDQNTVTGNNYARGGAIYSFAGNVTLSGDSIAVSGNKASATGVYGTAYGGVIYSRSGNVTLTGSVISLDQNTVSSNTSSAYGGVIYADGSVDVSGGTVSFTGNTASGGSFAYGGAIRAGGGVTLTAEDKIMLTGNKASGDIASGGAIWADGDVSLTGAAVSLTDNSAIAASREGSFHYDAGGAIRAGGSVNVTGGTVSFTGNAVAGRYTGGGAIHAETGDVTLTGAAVSLSGNTATGQSVRYDDTYAHGGAIYAENGGVLVSADAVSFADNSIAAAYDSDGGAIWASGDVTLRGGTISLANNGVSTDEGFAKGGAIFSGGSVTVGGGAVTLRGNRAQGPGDGSGGAIHARGDVTMKVGSLLAEGNLAAGDDAGGGAISAAGNVTLTSAGDIVLRGNRAEGIAAYASAAGAYGTLAMTAAGRIEIAANETVITQTQAEYLQSLMKHGASEEEAAQQLEQNKQLLTGALMGMNGMTLSADEVVFDGNRLVSDFGLTRGAAATITGSVDITARRTEFRTAGDSVTAGAALAMFNEMIDAMPPEELAEAGLPAGGLRADFRVTGTMYAAPGTLFAAPHGTVTVRGGDLELRTAPGGTAADASQLTSFAAREIDLGGARLVLEGEMPIERGEHRLDFAVVALPEGGAFTPPDISGYRRASLLSRDVEAPFFSGELAGLVSKDFDAKVLTLKYVNSVLIWNGGENGVWTTGGKNKGWIVAEDTSLNDDFYLGDDVFFTSVRTGEVQLSGDIEAASMTVLDGAHRFRLGGNVLDAWHIAVEGGEPQFSGGRVRTGAIHITGGKAVFDADTDVTSHAVFAEGGALSFAGTLDAPEGILVSGSAEMTVTGTAAAGMAQLQGGRLTLAAQDALKTRIFEMSGGTLALSSDRALVISEREDENPEWSEPGSFAMSGGTVTVDGAAARAGAVIVGSGKAELSVSGGRLNITGAQGAFGEGMRHRIAAGFTSADQAWTKENVTVDLHTARSEYDVENKDGAYDVIVKLNNLDLIWNGGDGGVWTGGEAGKKWLVSGDSEWKDTDEDFYDGDRVFFTSAGGGTVNVSGDAAPAAMTVDGDYTFAGTGAVNVAGSLNVNGGSVLFARQVSAAGAFLNGSETRLTLEQTLSLTGAFRQNGGTLVVNLNKLGAAAALAGNGTAELKIEGGALELIGDKADSTYTIAGGFKNIGSVWADSSVSGEAGKADSAVTYAVLSDDSSVSVSVKKPGGTTDDENDNTNDNTTDNETDGTTGGETDGKTDGTTGGETGGTTGGDTGGRIPFILTADQVLRNASEVGMQGQKRAAGLADADSGPVLFVRSFLPMDQGKKGGVWASTWYSHARVDNATADTSFKNYGVTLGADRQFGTGFAGLAVNLGKTEGRGRGAFEGSDSDGKHIGVSLYGARPIAGGRVTLAGDVGYHWHRDDYDSTSGSDYYSARKAKSRVFTAGATAWWNTGRPGARFRVKPFAGVRYSRFSMDDMTVQKNGADWSVIGAESVTQWTVPVGVKFDWTPVTTKKGWKVKPSAELAYVYAGGDRALNVREMSLSGGGTERSTQLLSDRNNFRASLGLEAKRKDVTIGIGVNALMSSGRKDVSVNATLRWDL